MSLPTLFITAFVVALSGALMPGPVLSATIHQTSKHGAKAGLLIAAGHSVPEIAVAVALFYGASAFLENSETLMGAIGVVGGLVLIAMAWAMTRYRPAPIEAEQGAGRDRKWLEPFAAGAITSLSNPHWYWWWAAIGLPYVLKARAHASLGLAIFYAGHIFADFAWFGFVGFAITRGRKIAGGSALKWLVRLCAAFMAALGAWFLVTGMHQLKIL